MGGVFLASFFFSATTYTLQTTSVSTTPSQIASLATALNNVTAYPVGSYIAPLSSFNQTNNSSITLLPLNTTILNNVTRIDNSSLIFEAGRQQNLYFRVPGAIVNQLTSSRGRRQISDLFTGLALRFTGDQNNDNIVIVPSNGMSSGITLLPTLLSDNSGVISFQMTAPPSMCSKIADSCIGLNYDAYLLFNNDKLSDPISNQVNVACGDVCTLSNTSSSACSASCGAQCNGQEVAGADTPVTRRYDLGIKDGTFEFIYQTYTIKDRILVWNGGVTPLFDSGCVGTQAVITVNLTLSSSDSNIRVDVEPDCDGGTGTAWYFTVVCP
jgi:hypothetical protein